MSTCRSCGSGRRRTVVDLGTSPLCESFVPAQSVNAAEVFYPLHAWVCEDCFLVQLEEYVSPKDIFTEYAYFSSFSDSYLEHARSYVDGAIARYGLGPASRVVELASNDGYLLQYFVARGIPCTGIEPAANVARAAQARNVPTLVEFFGTALARSLAEQGQRADLVIANNVLAQVPDLNDFIRGIGVLLAPGGVLTAEFPHLQRTLDGNQFDQVYHEHFSYFSLHAIRQVFERHGLAVFDVEEIATHGGSLRLHVAHASAQRPQSERLRAVAAGEAAAGVATVAYYEDFAERVRGVKRDLLAFLVEQKRAGRRVVGYGAPGKGNTFLNYCGIRTDFLDFTVDRNPYKHGMFTPGTRIPILHPDQLQATRPDFVLILPWNLRSEIVKQLEFVRAWGGKLVVAIPSLQVI